VLGLVEVRGALGGAAADRDGVDPDAGRGGRAGRGAGWRDPGAPGARRGPAVGGQGFLLVVAAVAVVGGFGG
jgi:hypothetical protein